MFKREQKGNVAVAISIIIAGIIIGLAVLFTGTKDSGLANNNPSMGANSNQQEFGQPDASLVKEPNEQDWIKGTLSAPVIIVEYSDTECPFCARLHTTLNEIVSENNNVAWVYRHLPLTQLHPQAVLEAHATECAGELGGNEGFWKYIDRLYAITPPSAEIDPNELPKIAEFAGINVDQFNTCMEEERHLSKVQEDYQEAVQAAGNSLGTPFNIVFGPNGERQIVNGALPKQNWEQIINQLSSN